jgi:osmotically-inducible protein OsmY
MQQGPFPDIELYRYRLSDYNWHSRVDPLIAQNTQYQQDSAVGKAKNTAEKDLAANFVNNVNGVKSVSNKMTIG